MKQIETLELARLLYELSVALYDQHLADYPEGCDEQEADDQCEENRDTPPRLLHWAYEQETADPYPIWLTVRLRVLAQAPGTTDEVLAGKLAEILGQERHKIDPDALEELRRPQEGQG